MKDSARLQAEIDALTAKCAGLVATISEKLQQIEELKAEKAEMSRLISAKKPRKDREEATE